ncbi:MAG: class I SAM-dependent methyltransferase [Luteibaculaceae bacterium]
MASAKNDTLETLTVCPVCSSAKHSHYISTKALMMANQEQESFEFLKCHNCESVFLNPRIKATSIGGYYPSYYLPYKGSEVWGKYKSFVEKSQRDTDKKRFQLVKDNVDKKTPVKLLDVGCGNPTFLSYCATKSDWHLTGIDFSDSGWREKDFTNLTLHITDLEQFNPNQKFDVITMWHYLEHDYNLEQTFSKISNLLSPNGLLIVEVPDYDSITQKLQKEYWEGWHTPRHTVLFHEKGFKHLAKKHNFTLKKRARYGSLDAFTLFWMGTLEKRNFSWDTPLFEKEFWPLVFKKIYTAPLFALEQFLPLGIQTVVFKKN